MPDKNTPVVHNREETRFEIAEDGLIALADYDPVEGAWVMGHTEVPRQWEGRGIAASLVRDALAEAREQGVKVIPSCSYVAAYMKRHKDVHDLVHESYRGRLGL